MYSKSWIEVPEDVPMEPQQNKDTTYRLRDTTTGERISTAVFWDAPKSKSDFPSVKTVALQVYPRDTKKNPQQFASLYLWILRWMLEKKCDLELSVTSDNHHFTYYTITYMPFTNTPEDTESATGEVEAEAPAPSPSPSPPLTLPREPKTNPFARTLNTVLDDLTLLQGSLIRAKRALLEIQPVNQYAYLNVLNSMDILNDIRTNLIKC